MKLITGKLAAAALAVGVLGAAAPASAAFFAQVGVSSGTPTINLVNATDDGSSAATLTGTGALKLNLIDAVTGALGPAYDINFQLNAMSSSDAFVNTRGGNTKIEQDFTGSFRFTFANAGDIDGVRFAAGQTVFAGTFTNAILSGVFGQREGSVLAGNATSFSNGFLTFQPGASAGFEFGLGGVSAPIGGSAAGGFNEFSASLNGKFSSGDTIGMAPIPEPATWAMMMLGFGMLGGALRRRGRLSVATTA